jgi:hypothetical protein
MLTSYQSLVNMVDKKVKNEKYRKKSEKNTIIECTNKNHISCSLILSDPILPSSLGSSSFLRVVMSPASSRSASMSCNHSLGERERVKEIE